MRVLMVTSEASPFAQTGGLGEVLQALPYELAKLGVEVDVLIPKYRGIGPEKYDLQRLPVQVDVDLNTRMIPARFWQLEDGKGVRHLFLENDHYYDREGLYGNSKGDYEDNSERFVFLCRAAIEMAFARDIAYDMFHCHDWQAALIPVYLRTLFAGEKLLERSASVLTIHNLGFQGIFGHSHIQTVGVSEELFNPEQMEFFGQLNFLKSGIVFADEVNTVSPGYRNEILTDEFGFGLGGLLQGKSAHVSGILNGVDYSVWNPEVDLAIAANFSAQDLSGKAVCKSYLQAACNLPVRSDVPLIGMVSRLSNQKGIDILEGAMPALVGRDVQFVLLGTGEKKYQESFQRLSAEYPNNVAVFLKYDEEVAHKVFAAADMVMVPSRYEPCGLAQLYGLKYGAVPIVRATGGLNDTVEEFNLLRDEGTGFKFLLAEPSALEHAITKALNLWKDNPEAWKRLMIRAMNKDFSWTRSAMEYKKLYEKALEYRKAASL